MFWRGVILFPIVSFIIHRTLTFIYQMGYHKTAYEHEPGPCHHVEGIVHGSEDIQVLSSGLAFISSGLRFSLLSENELAKRKGQIFTFDFNKPQLAPQPLKLAGANFETLNPHGLSLYRDKGSGKVTLFLINHLSETSVVERFRFEEKTKTLTHLQTISDKTFRYLNDLVAVSETTFYFTNLQYYRSSVEQLLAMPWGSVGFYDGTEGHIVLRSLLRPNGINTNANNRLLYLVHSGERAIETYSIEDRMKPILKQSIFVGSSCDNIDVDVENGDMWSGCHFLRHQASGYIREPSTLVSHSQVLRIQINADGLLNNSTITEVYSASGNKFSGSSVAVHYKKQMLVGSVASNLLHCHIKYI